MMRGAHAVKVPRRVEGSFVSGDVKRSKMNSIVLLGLADAEVMLWLVVVGTEVLYGWKVLPSCFVAACLFFLRCVVLFFLFCNCFARLERVRILMIPVYNLLIV